MPKYVLLFHQSPDLLGRLSPEEMQSVIQKYTEWRRMLEEEGRFVAGQKLREDGRILRQKGSQVSVTSGPYIEANEVIGGYFIIHAESYEKAVELARNCPHLRYGPVQVREIEHE